MVSPTTAPLLHHTTHGQAHTLHHNAPHTHQSDHNALMITHAIAHNTAHDDSCTTIAALSTKKLPAPPSCCSPHTLHQNMLLRARLALLMDTRTRPRKHGALLPPERRPRHTQDGHRPHPPCTRLSLAKKEVRSPIPLLASLLLYPTAFYCTALPECSTVLRDRPARTKRRVYPKPMSLHTKGTQVLSNHKKLIISQTNLPSPHRAAPVLPPPYPAPRREAGAAGGPPCP